MIGGAGTMTTYRAGNTAGRARIQALAPWCLLVFALVVLHLALMTSEHHGGIGASHHEGITAIPAALADLTAMPDHGHGHSEHNAPSSTLAGCPVGQATLPLLLLLGIVGLLFGRPAARIGGAMVATRRAPSSPPPLAATQRRALLQIFII